MSPTFLAASCLALKGCPASPHFQSAARCLARPRAAASMKAPALVAAAAPPPPLAAPPAARPPARRPPHASFHAGPSLQCPRTPPPTQCSTGWDTCKTPLKHASSWVRGGSAGLPPFGIAHARLTCRLHHAASAEGCGARLHPSPDRLPAVLLPMHLAAQRPGRAAALAAPRGCGARCSVRTARLCTMLPQKPPRDRTALISGTFCTPQTSARMTRCAYPFCCFYRFSYGLLCLFVCLFVCLFATLFKVVSMQRALPCCGSCPSSGFLPALLHCWHANACLSLCCGRGQHAAARKLASAVVRPGGNARCSRPGTALLLFPPPPQGRWLLWGWLQERRKVRAPPSLLCFLSPHTLLPRSLHLFTAHLLPLNFQAPLQMGSYNYAGCLTLPRVLHCTEDGRLVQVRCSCGAGAGAAAPTVRVRAAVLTAHAVLPRWLRCACGCWACQLSGAHFSGTHQSRNTLALPRPFRTCPAHPPPAAGPHPRAGSAAAGARLAPAQRARAR
jgi:hypothetical protein